jgi:hypothetical protein
MLYAKYLSVQTHGGRCCGIKTIWNFPYDPNTFIEEKRKTNVSEDTDYYGSSVSKTFNFYTEKRPRETAGERLKAILYFLASYRPAGLVEVTLTGDQLRYWGDFLESLGFKEVTVFNNSNTWTMVHVLHLVYGNQDGEDGCEDEDEYYENEYYDDEEYV